MNNRGFTLIELIAVIAIMATLGVIITINLSNMLRKTHEEECESFVMEVEEAACAYVGLNEDICNESECLISLDVLVKNGLIKSEEDKCVGKEIDLSKNVLVSFDSYGEKHCEYKGIREYER